MTKNFFFAVVICCFTCLRCWAQDEDIIVNFDPSGNLSLGATIDINNPNATKKDAFAPTTTHWLDGNSPKTTLKASLVSSTNELYEKMNLNINLKGEIKIPVFGGGKAEYDLKSQVESQNDDNKLYYVIEAYNDFGREEIQDVKLKKEFQDLLDTHKYTEFISTVGTHYVRRQRRASTIYALITIDKLNAMTKKSLDFNYSSSANINIAKVADLTMEQSVQYKKFINVASKLASVKIEYYSSGTEGISKLAGIFPQWPDDLSSILKAISAATESVSRENSKPVEYHVVSFAPYGLVLPPFDQDKSSCLSKLMDTKLLVSSTLNKVQQTFIKYKNSSFSSYYSQKATYLNSLLKSINKSEKSCLTNKICCQTLDKADPVYWLEDIVTVTKTEAIPDYIDAYSSDGSKPARILKSLRLMVRGTINNDEYYSQMNSYYLDSSFNPVETKVKFISNTNPSLSSPEKNGYFLTRDFVYVVDVINIDYETDPNSHVVYNNTNLDRSQIALNLLREKNYFIEVQSKDGLNYYVDLTKFNFKDIKTLFIN